MGSLLVILLSYLIVAAPVSIAFREAFQKLNKFHRADHLKDGVAPLTESKKLQTLSDQLNGNLKSVDANGPVMCLKGSISAVQFVTPEAAFEEFLKKLTPIIGKGDTKNEFLKHPRSELILTDEMKKQSKFLKGKLLQEGNFGRVFLGMTNDDDVNGNLVAIKQVKEKDPKFVKELVNEIKAKTAIGNHANLIEFVASGQASDNSGLNIAMEYMDGDVFDYFNLCTKFSRSTSTRILQEMFRGLSYMHGKGWGHRDIKLENLMAVIQNNKFVIKLIDFGRSVNLDHPEDSKSLAEGTYEMLSTFTHYGQLPSRSDDYVSSLLTFILLEQGFLEWTIYCNGLDTNEELTPEQNKKRTKVIDFIAQKKIEHIGILYGKYPDFLHLFAHLMETPTPDNIFLENCLLATMGEYKIFDNGEFDWDIRSRGILLDPHVIKAFIGVTKSIDGGTWNFKMFFEKFYSQPFDELKFYGGNVNVLEELNTIALTRISPHANIVQIQQFFETSIPAENIEDFKLSSFSRNNEILNLIRKHPTVFVGFGYYYRSELETYAVGMIVKGLVEILNTGGRIKQDSKSFLQETKLLNHYSKLYLTAYVKNKCNLPCAHRPNHVLSLVLVDEPIQSLEDGLRRAFAQLDEHLLEKLNNGTLSELGYAWRYVADTQSRKMAVYFTFKYNFDLPSTMPDLLGFTESMDNRNLSMKKESISTNEKNDMPFNNSQNSDKCFFQKTRSIHIETIAAAKTIIEEQFSQVNPLLNLRFEWIVNQDHTFDVCIVQDNCYLHFLNVYQHNVKQILEAYKNPSWIHHISHWKIFEGNSVLRQLANEMALDLSFGSGIRKLEHGQGLQIFEITKKISREETVESTIQSIVSEMNSFIKNKMLKYMNPYNVHSVTFGYSVMFDSTVNGVGICESYCYEALMCINKERSQLGLRVLSLHSKNDEIIESYMKNYDSRRDCSLYKNETTIRKQALSEFVKMVLTKNEKRYRTAYNKFVNKDATHIAFVAFQYPKPGTWTIHIQN